MTARSLLACSLVLPLAVACSGASDDGGAAGVVSAAPSEAGAASAEALAALPEVVRKAAETAVPGLVIQGVEQETIDDQLVYLLEGQANGNAYELKVGAEGQVHEVEWNQPEGEHDEGEPDEDAG